MSSLMNNDMINDYGSQTYLDFRYQTKPFSIKFQGFTNENTKNINGAIDGISSLLGRLLIAINQSEFHQLFAS